jgi:hypothetical protein
MRLVKCWDDAGRTTDQARPFTLVFLSQHTCHRRHNACSRASERPDSTPLQGTKRSTSVSSRQARFAFFALGSVLLPPCISSLAHSSHYSYRQLERKVQVDALCKVAWPVWLVVMATPSSLGRRMPLLKLRRVKVPTSVTTSAPRHSGSPGSPAAISADTSLPWDVRPRLHTRG